MTDRGKIFAALRNCLAEPKCGDCPWEDCERFDHKTTTVPVTLLLDVLELLREQKEEQKRIVSWLGKFCSHVDQHFHPLPDEQNIEFFRQKMKQLFGWDVSEG